MHLKTSMEYNSAYSYWISLHPISRVMAFNMEQYLGHRARSYPTWAKSPKDQEIWES